MDSGTAAGGGASGGAVRPEEPAVAFGGHPSRATAAAEGEMPEEA
jgi:hypothetical protein